MKTELLLMYINTIIFINDKIKILLNLYFG